MAEQAEKKGTLLSYMKTATGEDTKTEKVKKPETLSVDYWTYDDSYSVAVLRASKQTSVKTFENRQKLKTFVKDRKKKCKLKGIEFDPNGVVIPSGLPYSVKEPLDIQFPYADAFQDIMNLLSSCGTDTISRQAVLELVSSIFAGYQARFLHFDWTINNHEKLAASASPLPPTLVISDREPVFNALEQIFYSVSHKTANSEAGPLKCKSPIVLPAHTERGGKITDHAYIYCRTLGKEKDEHPFPMQYRDTAVLINAKMFKPKDLMDFQRRNLWATIVLYGATPTKVLDNFFKIDGTIFAHCDLTSWNRSRLQKVVSHYLYWLNDMMAPGGRDKKEIKKRSDCFPSTVMKDEHIVNFKKWFLARLSEADELINAHNHIRGAEKLQGTRWKWKRLQMVSVSSLLYFFVTASVLNLEQYTAVRKEWWNLLLPGCYPEADVERDLPLTERSVIDVRQSSKEIFEKTLNEIMKAAFPLHVVFYQANSPEPEGKPWGCVREYYDKTNDKSFKALIFPTRKLRTLGQKFCPVKCDWTRVIPEVRKKPPAYLYPAKACRIWGKSDPQDSIIINFQKAKFLSSEVRVSINRLFQEGSE